MAIYEEETLHERLTRMAGYDAGDGIVPDGGAHAEEFAEILTALRYIGNRKVDEYGDRRMSVQSRDYDLKMHYSDVFRKFIRYEHAVWKNQNTTVDQMMESLSDLAVYAVRGIQILKRLEELERHSCLITSVVLDRRPS